MAPRIKVIERASGEFFSNMRTNPGARFPVKLEIMRHIDSNKFMITDAEDRFIIVLTLDELRDLRDGLDKIRHSPHPVSSALDALKSSDYKD